MLVGDAIMTELYIRGPSTYTVKCCSADLRDFVWPRIEALEDGVRSWHTWPSARFPRIRPQELMRMLETLDSRCWLRPTLLRKPRSSVPNLRTWWLSSACFSRWDAVKTFWPFGIRFVVSAAPYRVRIGVLKSHGLKSCQESGATCPCMYVGR